MDKSLGKKFKSRNLIDWDGAPVYEVTEICFTTIPGVMLTHGNYTFFVTSEMLSADFIEIFDKQNLIVYGCEHEWKDYVGFRESFTYCKKCDQRKDF